MNVNPMRAGQGKNEELGQAESEGFCFCLSRVKKLFRSRLHKKKSPEMAI